MPPMTILVMAPAAVPLFQKKAPMIAGTITSRPADEATERTAISPSFSEANKNATMANSGTKSLPTLKSLLSAMAGFMAFRISWETMEDRVRMIELMVEIAAAVIPTRTSREIEIGIIFKASRLGVARSPLGRSGSSSRANKPHTIDKM